MLNYFIDDNSEYFIPSEDQGLVDLKWKRPVEIVDDPCLLESYESEIDGYLICGSMTPDWFPVILTLLKTKNLLNLIIKDIKGQDNFNKSFYNGCFEFCFFGNNIWTKIKIDDRLPVIGDESKSLFCLSSNKEEFLPSLLEKAYAKYLGGYAKLKNIDFNQGLMNFTGGIIENIALRRYDSPFTSQEQKIFFNKLKSLSGDTFVFCDSCENNINDTETKAHRNFLIPKNHYYLHTGLTRIPAQYNNLNIIDTVLSSLLDLKNQESIYMMRLRNPVFKGDWNGPFSVGSLEWEGISENIRRHFNLKFNHEFEFWMTVEDLNRNMSKITLCHIPSESYLERVFRSTDAWYSFFLNRKISADVPGGSITTLANEFLRNDQYIMEIVGKNSIEMKIILTMNCTDETINFTYGCGIVLLKVENNRCYRLHNVVNSELLDLKVLSKNGNSCTVSVTLVKGKYILLPWRNIDVEAEYYFRLYTSQKGINVSLLEEDKPSFVYCLKCNFVSKLMKTKDFVASLSPCDNHSPSQYRRRKCSSCVITNPELAIRMTVVSISNLQSNEDKSHKNSYFVLKMSNYSYRSNTKYLTNNPCWNDSFIFYKTKTQKMTISVDVFAEQKLEFDKVLGTHVFSEADFSNDNVTVVLKLPFKKEWIYTSSKLNVKFKTYPASLFDAI